MAAASMKYGMVIRPTSGSTCETGPGHKVYRHPKTGLPYKAVSGEEYADFLIELANVTRSKQTRSRKQMPIWVLHDNARHHTTETVKATCLKYNIQLLQLPPSSPDLCPLDYGVFAEAKPKWWKTVLRRKMLNAEHWEEACDLFNSLLQNTHYKEAIEQLPRRLEACIASKGGHFEKEFNRASKRQKVAH
jgi:transposase